MIPKKKMVETKKVITTTNKGLVVIASIGWFLVVILFLSGLKINPILLFLAFCIITFAVFYFLKKPKELDAYALVNKWKIRHYKETLHVLDTADFQAIPVTPSLTFVYLPMEAKTAYIENGRIRGFVTRQLLKVLKEQEKSKLFDLSQKHLGAEAKIREQARLLNIDLESLGIEENA